MGRYWSADTLVGVALLPTVHAVPVVLAMLLTVVHTAVAVDTPPTLRVLALVADAPHWLLVLVHVERAHVLHAGELPAVTVILGRAVVVADVLIFFVLGRAVHVLLEF